ncbi:MAG: pyridoxine 5'-phosphate synthase [Candidatus Kapaibacterium sp.]
MMTLNVNIDHVATIRQARLGKEPDPVLAALNAELAGASGIVCHLREDRRHVQDRDVYALRDAVQTKLDLEMASSEEIIKIALDVRPDLVTIVPEKRQELTTEGGLNVLDRIDELKKISDRMHGKDIEVSLFIEPNEAQIEASIKSGADMVEFHTGTYSEMKKQPDIEHELERLEKACRIADSSGLKIAAGHGLNYLNIAPLCKFREIHEFSIGHSIISRAIHTGVYSAVQDMLQAIRENY